MSQTDKQRFSLQGPSGSLSIKADDKLSRQIAMLVEGQCLGLGPNQASQKYHYSKQRYFQILKVFYQHGSDGLLPRKTGPKTNHVRTEQVVTQIVRHRFLDPDANAEVIVQKMRQCGFRVSQRSVERTLAERGLQKKTL